MARAESAKAAPGIKVLGAGCPKCRATEASAKEALAELGMTDEVEHVTDFASIAAYGVMSTPALVVDGKVVSCGKALTKDEARAVIAKAREWNEPPAEGGLRLRAQLLPEPDSRGAG